MSLFGVASKGNCISDLFNGTDYHSHRATEFGGIAYLKNDGKEIGRKIHNISETGFRAKFSEYLGTVNSPFGIGVISPEEEQPITLDGKVGNFAICIDGKINNAEQLAHELKHTYGATFKEKREDGKNNTAEIVATLINQEKDIVDGIEYMHERIDGSISLLLLTKQGIYASGDRFPLFVGKRDDAWAIASENCAFPNLGFQPFKIVEPRETVKISESGLIPKKEGVDFKQICAFLWIYTGFPASRYEDIYAEIARYRTGAALARRDSVKADIIGGIPDSGTAHGLGYAMETVNIARERFEKELNRFENKEIDFKELKQNLNHAFDIITSFQRPFIKYGWARSYIPSKQEKRDEIAKRKLIPVVDLLKLDMVITEDSIVRATQLQQYLEKVYGITITEDVELGEIHIRPACPPLMYPCKFNLSTKTIEELAARKAIYEIEGQHIVDVSEYINPDSEKYKQMVEIIRQNLGKRNNKPIVTSLMYQRLDDMVEAIGLPRKDLCLYCWNGEEVPPSAKK